MTSDDRASRTALTAAAARAAHLIVDDPPVIFADTLALALLGDQAEEYIGYHRAHAGHVVLAGARGQVTCRSRYAEDGLADAVARGIRQYVILGAGLDSFAYRAALAAQVRVFEVDHPATQQWKRSLLAGAGIGVPANVAFVPVDFEADSLALCLARSGFDPARPAFVSWLGVTMYLTLATICRTLADVSGFAPGSQIVVDYMLPPGLRDEAGDSYAELVAPVAAQRGEPWLTFLGPREASALLARHRLELIRHVAQGDIGDGAMCDRTDSLRPIALSLIAHATVPAAGRSAS